MARMSLPSYWRDPGTGLMNELTFGGPRMHAFDNDHTDWYRVLVADDHEMDRLLTIRQLGRACAPQLSLIVECAAEGATALDKLQERAFSLAVLDWNMPERNGGDVLRAIRQAGKPLPVVIVSGERLESIEGDIRSMAAVFVGKNELDSRVFRNAIAVATALQSVVVPVTPTVLLPPAI